MSDEVKKTIFMSKEQHEKWDKALRSGEYKQAREQLRNRDSFCCLGVLQHCLSGRVQRNGEDEVPAMSWLRKHNIVFKDFFGMSTNNPKVAKSSLAQLNDDYYDFNQLADLIQQHVKYV